MTVTNTDNLGNIYYNQLGNPNGIQGSFNFNNTEFNTFFTTATTGNSYFNRLTNSVSVRLNNPNETFNGTNPRFQLESASTANNNNIYTSATNGTSVTQTHVLHRDAAAAQGTNYAVSPPSTNAGCAFLFINNWCIYNLSTYSKTLISPTWDHFKLVMAGWLKDPLYTGVSIQKSLFMLEIGVVYGQKFFSASVINNQAVSYSLISCIPSFMYGIDCVTPTVGADTTDVILRTNDQYLRAIGRVPDMLLYKGTLAIGTIINNQNTDPEGCTNPYWVCVYNNPDWGSLLVRVWVSGI